MSYSAIPILHSPDGSSGSGAPDCGKVTSQAVPPGVTNALHAGYDPSNVLLCDVSDPTAALCNTTGNPAYCFFAKKYGQKMLGRGSEADLAAWIAWNPGGATVPMSYTPGGAAPGAAPSDGVPTWALALGGVAILGVVGFFVLRKLRPMSYAFSLGSSGLGDASASAESDLLLAVAQDVASGNLSESKINDYASKAGAAAAVGGCTMAGGGAAAPLCAYVGGKIGGAIAGMFTGGSKESLPDLQARLVNSVVPLCEGDADCKYLLTWYANVLGRCLYSYQEALYIKPGVYGAGDPAMSELWSKITWTPSTPFFDVAPRYVAWIQNTVEPWFKRSVATVVAAAKLRRERKFLQGVIAYRSQLQKQYLPQCPASIPSCQTELYGIISQWAMATKAANERGLQLYAGRASYSDASYRAEVEGKLASFKAQQKAAVTQKSQADAANLRLGRQEASSATSADNARKLVVAGLVVGAGILGIFALKKRG